MKIRMLRPTYINRRLVMDGEAVEVRQRIGKDLVDTKRAVISDSAPELKTQEEERDENGDSTWQ